jgi:hypothetical protein
MHDRFYAWQRRSKSLHKSKSGQMCGIKTENEGILADGVKKWAFTGRD